MKVLLAMSGGVDSSVTAHLLKEQGYDVVGVRFTLWQDPLAPAMAQILSSKCCNAETASRSAVTAKKLGIPLHVIDLADEFKRTVVDPFLDEYKHGRTPNPCIGCNRTLKFGALMKFAREQDCEVMATGHYVRVATEKLPDGSERAVLLEAEDKLKDQSYYLYSLSQEQLKHCIFPLGTMRKTDVIESAKRFGVPLPKEYQESQDLCFFPEKSPHEFLKRHLKGSFMSGPILRKDGKEVGTHKGLPFYTPGQRRGLGVGGLKIPLEVIGKNAASNSLIVADKDRVKTTEVRLSGIRFVNGLLNGNIEERFEYRTRSLGTKSTGILSVNGNNGIFRFDSPTPPQAAGQSLVLYRGEEVVGGGVMM